MPTALPLDDGALPSRLYIFDHCKEDSRSGSSSPQKEIPKPSAKVVALECFRGGLELQTRRELSLASSLSTPPFLNGAFS